MEYNCQEERRRDRELICISWQTEECEASLWIHLFWGQRTDWNCGEKRIKEVSRSYSYSNKKVLIPKPRKQLSVGSSAFMNLSFLSCQEKYNFRENPLGMKSISWFSCKTFFFPNDACECCWTVSPIERVAKCLYSIPEKPSQASSDLICINKFGVSFPHLSLMEREREAGNMDLYGSNRSFVIRLTRIPHSRENEEQEAQPTVQASSFPSRILCILPALGKMVAVETFYWNSFCQKSQENLG